MTNQELYKQAILDAKAVRETALAAAKESLSEAFEPRIMEMMRLKLAEELEENIDEVDEATEMEESMEKMENESMRKMKGESMMRQEEGSDKMDEAALDEILAELNALSEEMQEEAELEEGATGYDEKAKVTHGDKKLHEADDEEEGGEEKAEEDDKASDEGPVSDDDEVIELSVGELKQIFRDAFTQAQGAGAPTDMAGTLDAEAEMEMGGMPSEMEELSLEEILAELEGEDKMEEATGPGGYEGGNQLEEKMKVSKMEEKMKNDLKEANQTITVLKTELNEINLLNAKLLYFNKVLKAKSLNESQKVKVMNAFDRAVTVKEVENTYRTLSESITAPKKTALKESMGFASKPIGTAPAKPIVEADAFVSRWQTLAGIK
jgi:hypothetical protein